MSFWRYLASLGLVLSLGVDPSRAGASDPNCLARELQQKIGFGIRRGPIVAVSSVNVYGLEGGILELRAGTVVSLYKEGRQGADRRPAKVVGVYSNRGAQGGSLIELQAADGNHFFLNDEAFLAWGGRLASADTLKKIASLEKSGQSPFPPLGERRARVLQEHVSAYERKFPPLSTVDTVFSDGAGKLRGLHQAEINLFGDSDIIRVNAPVRHGMVGSNGLEAPVFYTQEGHAVIQQQAQRGCTAATVAMLLTDRGGKVRVEALRGTNMGNTRSQVMEIQRAGFRANVTPIGKSIERLAEVVGKGGSAIVDITGEIGGHVIIVDKVDLNKGTAVIRDPWHGWEIVITTRALERRLLGSEAIQIAP